MQAVITAGGSLKVDNPLFLETNIAKKALIPIAGKKMVQWVADSLLGSDYVDGLIVVGLQEGDVDSHGQPIHFIADQGGIVDNVMAGIDLAREIAPDSYKVLLSSSDIPLITTSLINEFVQTCQQRDMDIYYTVVEEQTMEARFPNSQRTFTLLKGGRYTGGDLLMLDHRVQNANIDLFRGATGQRKNFLGQARLVGFTFIFRFLFRLMDLAEAQERACKALNVNGWVIDFPQPEIGMDIDKLAHFQLVERELEATRL